jgi:hypothetical protein
MTFKKNTSAQLNIVGIIILGCLVLATLCLGVYGFNSVYVVNNDISNPELTRWFDILYSTIKLFSLISSPAEEAIKHWAISAARLSAVCSVFFSLAFATFFAAGSWIKSNILVSFYKDHYIVFGLNTESSFLINDLIKRKEKVVVVEGDHNNPLLLQFKKQRATLIIGDGSSLKVQLKASILNAKAIVTMSGCDLHNLAILKTIIEAPHKPHLHCHIAIDNVMSYKLFEPGAYYSIKNIKKRSPGLLINIFDLNELIAINLVQSMNLGGNTDTTSDSSEPVSILISGFGVVGEAVLRELLLLTHFCNHKKTKIVIVTSEENDFFISHHQVLQHCNGRGFDLWDIEFVSSEDNITQHSNFNHIIACDEDENVALKNILRLYDLCTLQQMREKDLSTTFHYYNAFKHDIEHEQIQTFGALEKISSYSQILNSQNEKLAQTSHNLYAKAELGLTDIPANDISKQLEEYDQTISDSNNWLHWFNQPLFKRRSNFTEKRHFPMKLLALGGAIPDSVITKKSASSSQLTNILPFIDDFNDLDTRILKNWVQYIKEQTGLNDLQLKQRMTELARTEHDRWNAYHIVNNWRYGSNKDEGLKTHDCLLTWEDLSEKRPDTIKYDYKNIYHIAQSLAV